MKMESQFKDLEQAFLRLKMQFERGEISRTEFIADMKKLRFRDEDGRFWMIGAQSGRWYYFDGKDWIQSEPPSLQEGKAICIYCGFENKLENDVCVRCGGSLLDKEYFCPKCGSKLDGPFQDCPRCSREKDKDKDKKEWAPGESPRLEEEKTANFVFRSLHPFSFFFFTGTAGFLLGIILGAFAGTTDYFSTGNGLPPFLQEVHGNLIGGLIFACLGGVFGFLFLGLTGFLLAIFINAISSFVGGIKITLSKTDEEEKISRKED